MVKNMNKNVKPHYAWIILAACCAIQGGTMGLIQNSCGVFYSPIAKELNIGLSAVTLYSTIRGLVSTFTLPLVSKVLKSKRMKLYLTIFAIIYGGMTISMGFFNHIYQWYIASAIQGIASSFFTSITCPLIIGNWFKSKRGFAMGFSASFTGIVGMGSNYLAGKLITNLGWRNCYIIFGIVALIILTPAVSLILYYQPSDKGLTPYYVENSVEKEKKKVQSISTIEPKYYLFFFVLQIFAMLVSGFTQQLSSLGESLGMITAAASLLPSISMAGNMLGKIILGSLSDSFGILPITIFSFALPLLGNFLLMFNGYACYPASFFVGTILSTAAVIMPIFIRSFTSEKDYESVYTKVSMFGSITYSLSNTVYGALYDLNSGYNLSIIVNCILMLVCILICMLTKKVKVKQL